MIRKYISRGFINKHIYNRELVEELLLENFEQ